MICAENQATLWIVVNRGEGLEGTGVVAIMTDEEGHPACKIN